MSEDDEQCPQCTLEADLFGMLTAFALAVKEHTLQDNPGRVEEVAKEIAEKLAHAILGLH